MRPAALAALSAGAVAAPAFAHSFGRAYNLPVPVWMYLFGASAALALSFVIVAWFLTAPAAARSHRLLELGDTVVVRALRRLRPIAVLKVASLLALTACIVTGLFGTRNPYLNFNMTFFWIVFVLGFAYLTALVGDWYAVISPWKVICDGLGRLWRGFARGRIRYPERLGYWPALAFYMAFIWIELFGRTTPLSLAVLLLGYTGVNLLGVWLIGSQAWFRYCEFLGVFFRLIARMAPLEYRPAEPRAGARLRLRPPFLGLLEERAGSVGLLVFVLFMLSSTAFDGLRSSVPWVRLFWVDIFRLLEPWVGSNPIQAYAVLRPVYLAYETAALLLSPFLYLCVYLVFVWLAKGLSGSTRSVRDLALQFGFSLLPIALVYNITHYYTLIQTQGVKIVRLVSDPLGAGWNLFGTADWLRYAVIPDAGTVWHTQVGLILFGHIVSVYLAHAEALRMFPSRRQATLSQLPILLLMVMFTSIGLWILSQPLQPGA